VGFSLVLLGVVPLALGDGSDWNQRNVSEIGSKFSFGFSEILEPVSNGYGSDRINLSLSLLLPGFLPSLWNLALGPESVWQVSRTQIPQPRMFGSIVGYSDGGAPRSTQSHSRWKHGRVSPKTRKKISSDQISDTFFL
jgi:hypothetical protein